MKFPPSSVLTLVPPAATTYWEHAGYSVMPPRSPLAAKNSGPLRLKWTSSRVSPENSRPPQLMDTATTPGRDAALSTAANMSDRRADLASTRTILARGARA